MHDNSSSVVSYRQIFVIAIPVMLANFFLPLQSLIDTAVVGHFDTPSYLAGMAIAIQAFTIITVSFNFIQYATSGLSAQAFGASSMHDIGSNKQRNSTELLFILQRSLSVALLLGLLVMMFRDPIIHLLLTFFFTNLDSNLIAEQYLTIRMWAIVPELMNYAFIGFFAGTGHTKKLLHQQLFISATNLVVTLTLVYGMNLRIEAVAIGTALAQWLGLAYAVTITARTFRIPYKKLLNIIPVITMSDTVQLKKLFSLNINIFIRTLLLVLSFAWITKLSAQAGELVLATNIILLQILTLSSYLLDGIAISAESLTGQYVGKKDWQALKKTIKMTAICSYCFAIFLSCLWMFSFPYYLYIMTDFPEITELANTYKWYAILLPIVGVGAYWLDGILFGLTDGKTIKKVSIYVTLVFVPCSIILTKYVELVGIWLSIWLLLLLRFIFSGYQIYKNHPTIFK